MAKRQLIMEKAIELFAKQGIESTSVQQITELCGISKGAFYLSFKSKDELIVSIIDDFIKKITSDIDRVVNSPKNVQEKLYDFYLSSFKLLQDHREFAKMFIKEQLHTVNQALLNRINYYEQLTNQAMLRLLDELYGEKIKENKYDLLISMRGLTESYSKLFFTINVPLNLPLLARALVEKTNLLANHTSIVFLNENLVQQIKHPSTDYITITKIIQEIDRLKKIVTNQLESESLDILKNQLQNDVPTHAIILGLLQNIKNNEDCKWLVFMVEQYLNNK
ncbi:TetR/AcrR family transcriptional regulator [Caldibacillus lycopersici]|uniref:TetR/AcrR family transcriptional regulator n=1 Tax=Perspicuibacillus lycopersici TaxID=1325689 RepID=A0AAE3LM53_9BACI|nr:TetR/AcrR family transcriptional regulator [Perspicuibacillus lycopersici]MCU9612357.1 TetR/AcrR family transcriptional regulator [Perspicuibacillus lycopersici]